MTQKLAFRCTIEEEFIQKRSQRSLLLLGYRIASIPCHASYSMLPMKSSYSSNHPGANHPLLHIVLVQNRYKRGKELKQLCTQAAGTTFAFSSSFSPTECVALSNFEFPAALRPFPEHPHYQKS